MKIAIIVEGKTEVAFMPALRKFIEPRVKQMPRLHPVTCSGRIPKENELKRDVENLLYDHDAVIALTDVYTGTSDFKDASDAKAKMKQWVGNNARFYPHAAQYDFEAWLLPFWPTIQELAKNKKPAPPGPPEQVNHTQHPSKRIEDIFAAGKVRDYNKWRDAKKILEKNDLLISAKVCLELKAFLNTILLLSGGEEIP